MIREPGLIVLLRHLLLSHKTLIETWLMLLEEGRESHCVITGLNSLPSTIQSPIEGEEISEGAFYWIERGTLLVALALTLLCISTEGASKCPTHSIPKLLFLTMR